jgi:low-density lipoprotein receptor-related protein 1 (alpha-2-macroglobulin receptor)
MYWTNWHDKQASIQSAYLWGDDVQTIISTNIQTPNGLAIDRAERKLYWSDARLDKIERCNWDGTDRKVCLRSLRLCVGIGLYSSNVIHVLYFGFLLFY